ncbi:multidrug resistance protein fnx1 [Apiospora aurea]|uniref:Multidrug resistance protein fnx1 n=1 Tax=Apiospora aurea TaxID=335848 RepID=A0ABR1QPA5_9PEZI
MTSAAKHVSGGPSGSATGAVGVAGAAAGGPDSKRSSNHRLGLWAIIIGLGITFILSALEHSVLVTAAPVVLSEMSLGDNWIWLTNAFFLCSAAFQPLFGRLFDIFGRRPVTLCIVVIFMLGSTICGAAVNGQMLIAGRAVQGVGSGGIAVAFETIVSDLIPLRDRGNYIAIVMLIYSIGTTLGPFIGGAIAEATTWRWIFYINLPIGSVSLFILFISLRVNFKREAGWANKLKRIDFIGNSLLIASTTSILYALSYAGTRYQCSSWHTLLPLLLGIGGYILFAMYETSKWPIEPLMPPRLFCGRTSAIVAINNFQNQILLWWGVFFLPVYFQSVQLASPKRAGVCLIPLSLFALQAAAVSGAALTRIGRYKMIHLIGFAIFTVGRGLYTLLDEETPTREWVAFQLVAGVGSGMLLNTLLPAFQAPLREADQATATATFNFIRTLGSVWGIAIPSAIFINHVNEVLKSGALSDPVAIQLLSNGGAYQYAAAAFVEQSPPSVKLEIRAVYREDIQRVFIVRFAFMGLALFLALFEKDIPLRRVLLTDYGLTGTPNNITTGAGSEPDRRHAMQADSYSQSRESGAVPETSKSQRGGIGFG